MVVGKLVRKRGDEVGTRWERWERSYRGQRIFFDGEVSGGLATIQVASMDGRGSDSSDGLSDPTSRPMSCHMTVLRLLYKLYG